MTLLLVALMIPLVAAIVLAGGRPGPVIGCLCLMGIGCLIACSGLTRLVRQRA